jgi:hypothetical protein
MKAVSKFALGLTLAWLGASCAFAQRVDMKGVGTAAYPDKRSTQQGPAADQQALAQARLAAWRNYVAAQNSARQQAIAAHEADFLANLDKFIIETVVLDSVKDDKSVKLVARFGFNEEAVNQMLGQLTVGGNGQQGARSQDSTFTFVFMARKATSIQHFAARRTEVRQAEVADTTADDGAATASRTAIQGGSSQQKADVVTYAVTSSQDLDAAMGEVLTNANIEPVGYDDIVSNCNGVPQQKFQAEFVQSDELTPQTRAAVIKSARECEVRYLAYGTIDTEVASIDPVTGNQKAFVSVRAQLWDISKKLPRKIGSVGPKQYSGLGPDQNVASRSALSVAARDLARTLVDQLNAKGIR